MRLWNKITKSQGKLQTLSLPSAVGMISTITAGSPLTRGTYLWKSAENASRCSATTCEYEKKTVESL